jgi:hypothetical protein
MALDEYGIPTQLGAKLEKQLSPDGDLDLALARLRDLNIEHLPVSPFEKALLRDAVAHL